MSAPGLFRYDICLGIRAPFLIGGGAAARFGVDVIQLRDPDGRPIIPDTHLKGVLRAAWIALANADFPLPMSVEAAFGREGSDARGENAVDDLEPRNRGALIFRDLRADHIKKSGRLTRVAINDETGSGVEGKLQTVELVAQPGSVVRFRGALLAWLESADQAASARSAIESALDAVFAIGRGKTVGYGQVVEREISGAISMPVSKSLEGMGKHFLYRFRLDKRLLVNTTRPDSNTLSGEHVIPGGVLKGALAEKLRRLGLDPLDGSIARALSDMVISHALPTSTAKLPDRREDDDHRRDIMVRLDSVGLEPDNSLEDNQFAFRWDDALPISQMPNGPIPDFKSDAKDTPKRVPNAPSALESVANYTRDDRMRNAIDSQRGTAADGKLFVESAIHPEFRGIPLEWQGTIYCPDGVGPEARLCLEHLAGGLVTLGKTASATITARNLETLGIKLVDAPEPPRLPLALGQRVEVEICTPALMLREWHLASQQRFSDALEAFWQTLGNGAFRLAPERPEPLDSPGTSRPAALDFFCQVALRAGYQALRYEFFGQTSLEPFVLTQTGSVFRLEILDPDKASEILHRIAVEGLPVAAWDVAPKNENASVGVPELERDLDFTSCPFLPQNGFGQVSVQIFEVAK